MTEPDADFARAEWNYEYREAHDREYGYNVCVECGSSLGADDYMGPEPPLCDFCREHEREEYGSPCDCDYHRGMTADQAWSTLP